MVTRFMNYVQQIIWVSLLVYLSIESDTKNKTCIWRTMDEGYGLGQFEWWDCLSLDSKYE